MRNIFLITSLLSLVSCASLNGRERIADLVNIQPSEKYTREYILNLYGSPNYTKVEDQKRVDIYTIDKIQKNKVLCRNIEVSYESNQLVKSRDISEISVDLHERCMKFALKKSKKNFKNFNKINEMTSREDLIYNVGAPASIFLNGDYKYEVVAKKGAIVDCKDFRIVFDKNIIFKIIDISTNDTQIRCNRIAYGHAENLRSQHDIISGLLFGQKERHSASKGPLFDKGLDNSCQCPNDRASDGSRCGNRSAYYRNGGLAPVCYSF
ncbi:putative lipoprotein [Bacteriovorax sp. BSW11_IV]|uniref:hypothetical protein n=1 Tax=Bacteriovorax sp. BSW11_IV TaxID=1353529 RepID=UPI00038A3F8E|nr:hypothetical protein [Bacteriovorax sp. BSW11_IV]EQC48696.1 putative lipoprotein [Bacteriovorax sp. BSW11_IV]